MANAQLHERVRVLQGQLDGARLSQQDQVATLTAQLEAQALEVQRLTSTASQLRDELQQLRAASEQGAVDPSMINGAMMAELEALRTTRAAEATEMNDILSALGQVLDAEEARTHA
jgi:galactokinase